MDKSNLNVLYVTHSTDLSGANRSMLQMILELRDYHGVKPFVVFPKVFVKNTKTIEDVLRENNIPALSHRLSYFQRKKTGIFYMIYYIIFSPLYLFHLLFLLRNKKFDIVHSNSSIIDTGLYISKFLHIPHVWHFREVAALSFNAKSVLGEGYQRWVYSKTDKIIAISHNVRDEFKGLIPMDKTVVIPNGVKPPVFQHFPDHDSNRINICIVGRVEPNKNQLEAVEALSYLATTVLGNVRLHIIGNSLSEYGSLISKHIKENKLDDVVILHGVKNNVDELLQNMNIGLMLSKHEAFGRVTVEYMMHGVCVIASNTSANPEIIKDGENGLLYNIGNPEDLANKISLLVNNRAMLKKLSQEGYDNAMRNYQSRTNSERVYEQYLLTTHY